MVYLAIDLGDKRTGLAVGDDETRLASPLRVIERPLTQRGALLDDIAGVVEEYRAGALVLGLPINMDDSEGPRAKLVRDFAAELGARTGLAVHLRDERLTSDAADWDMAQSGLTRGQKKQRRDGLAAAAILRDFLADR